MYCLYNLSLVRIDLIILEVTHGFFGVNLLLILVVFIGQ